MVLKASYVQVQQLINYHIALHKSINGNYLDAVSPQARRNDITLDPALGRGLHNFPVGESSGASLTIGRWNESNNRSSWNPVGGIPPLPPLLKKKVLLGLHYDYASLVPLIIVSAAYFSTSDSVSNLLDVLNKIGSIDEIWIKDMLGISGGDITSSVNHDVLQESSIDGQQSVYNKQKDYQFMRLLGLVVGTVALGALVLCVGSSNVGK